MSDSADSVPDAVWFAAEKHFDEGALAGFLLPIATTKLFNRLDVTTRQMAGQA